VRLVLEHQGDYRSRWAAISSIAAKSGMSAETLRRWVRRAEVDSGQRSGLSFSVVGDSVRDWVDPHQRAR